MTEENPIFDTASATVGVFDHRNVHRNPGTRNHLSCNREYKPELPLERKLDRLETIAMGTTHYVLEPAKHD